MKTKIKSGSATALKNTEAEASHKACSNCPSLSPTPAYTITCGQMRHTAEKWSHAHLPFAGEDHILSSSIPLLPAPQMMAEDKSWSCFQAKNPTKQNNIGETKGSMDNLPKYLISVSSLSLMCNGSNHCYRLSNPLEPLHTQETLQRNKAWEFKWHLDLLQHETRGGHKETTKDEEEKVVAVS